MNHVTSERREWASSLIKSSEYTPDYKSLVIVFVNEEVYQYTEVSEEDYNQFCSAESQGKFFIENFRTGKPYKKVI